MPKRKERMAGYIRESDPSLADSTTIESQAKAVRAYGEKEHYMYEPQHEYKEAISAYQVPYMERPELLKMLKAAQRREFDVLVVTEIRAISRRQVEVFIIYDMLQKYNVRLETIREKFEDDAMGRLILGLRAAYAEIEREQSYIRMQRGKKDRIEISKAPNGHPKAAYGYIFLDGEREVKASYAFNHAIIYVDENGIEWSEYKVCMFIFSLLGKGESLRHVANRLNELGIPTPKKSWKGEPHWTSSALHRIITNRIYIGEVYANRWKRVKAKNDKWGMVKRPQEEWILLPDGTAPTMIEQDTFERIQKQLAYNKQDSLRNSKHPEELGLLRAGYIFCGVCGRRMHIVYPGEAARLNHCSPTYCCRKNAGNGHSLNHRTQVHVPMMDKLVWEKVITSLQNYELVRAKVEEKRQEAKPVVDSSDIEATIETIRHQMQNLFNLAQNATDDETIAQITERMNNLEKLKREAQGLLYDIADDDEERSAVEEELLKFEEWARIVRPHLTNPSYMPTYEEMRLAIRILGLKVIVYPTLGEWPFRYHIDITIPEIIAKLHCADIDGSMSSPFAPW